MGHAGYKALAHVLKTRRPEMHIVGIMHNPNVCFIPLLA